MQTRPLPRSASRGTSRGLAALAALALLGALSACGTDDSADTASDTPTTADASESGDGGSFEPSAEGECAYPTDGNPAVEDVEAPPADPTVEGEVEVSITTSAGDIDATLDADRTPCTVGSFVSLLEQGYFDGTECHRLTTQGIFVLQCGDPTATGTGGPGYTIPDELTGDETYPAGTLAMAKTPYPDSGGSQFFMVYEDTPLPPEYTVFGSVDQAGVEVLREVAAEGTSSGAPDGPPATPVVLETVSAG